MPAWLLFSTTAAVVIVAGSRLARYGDQIARRSVLGAAWVGAILVAGATSLPEIATAVAAARQGTIDLAVGGVFGSNMANVAILAVADIATRQQHLLTRIAREQAMVVALAISLSAVATIGLLSPGDLTLGGVGWALVAVAAGYVLGMRMLYRNRRERRPQEDTEGDGGLRGPIIGFAIAAAAVVSAAPFLTSSGATLAEQWGIATGFFGVAFLAAATSLPEVSTVFSSMRQGAYDLAVGNLMGSNCFNMVVLVIVDAVNGASSLLAVVEPSVATGAVFGVLLMGQVLLDHLNRPERRVWYLEPGPGLILATYGVGLFLAYRATH